MEDKIVCQITQCNTCEGINGTSELHSCPFREKIYNDDTFHCNCCPTCLADCIDNI